MHEKIIITSLIILLLISITVAYGDSGFCKISFISTLNQKLQTFFNTTFVIISSIN
jgi:hypothetical protein